MARQGRHLIGVPERNGQLAEAATDERRERISETQLAQSLLNGYFPT
jgi:hypothetical protein